MEESILTEIKKMLGITEDYEHFDTDVMIHINSAFNTLYQLGVMDQSPFTITGKEEKWSDYFGDEELYKRMQMVKPYIFLKVKQAFDPSGSSVLSASFDNQIKELEWRLMIEAEAIKASRTE